MQYDCVCIVVCYYYPHLTIHIGNTNWPEILSQQLCQWLLKRDTLFTLAFQIRKWLFCGFKKVILPFHSTALLVLQYNFELCTWEHHSVSTLKIVQFSAYSKGINDSHMPSTIYNLFSISAIYNTVLRASWKRAILPSIFSFDVCPKVFQTWQGSAH